MADREDKSAASAEDLADGIAAYLKESGRTDLLEQVAARLSEPTAEEEKVLGWVETKLGADPAARKRLAEHLRRHLIEKGREAEVVSAVSLTAAEQERLREALESRYGGELAIRNRVDPAVLGGLVVRVGDEVIDLSVSRNLDRLEKRLGRG